MMEMLVLFKDTVEYLKAMGVEKELLGSTLRFSFSFETTEEEIDHCLGALNDLLPMLRRYVRR